MTLSNQQITTVTFLKYKDLSTIWWAMRQMQEIYTSLQSVPGLEFYKLLGNGGGDGFSIVPNMGNYALVAVWKDQESANKFFETHTYWYKTLTQSHYYWTAFLSATKARGTWEQQKPFAVHKQESAGKPIAVLTRATIHPKKLWSFWKNVPKVSSHLEKHKDGLLFSKGMGEVPFLRQATFSMWENRDAMVAYAYQSTKHREMIKKTRALGWYKEELFAEFIPTQIQGNWPDMPDPTHYYEPKLSH